MMDTSRFDELEEDHSVDHCCYIAQGDKKAYKTEKWVHEILKKLTSI